MLISQIKDIPIINIKLYFTRLSDTGAISFNFIANKKLRIIVIILNIIINKINPTA